MENDFVVIVAGSRDYDDYGAAKKVLDKAFANKKPSQIVSGMAKGADMLGYRYANEHKIPVLQCWANWEKYGRSAGYIRNAEMAKRADALIAFWDGDSPGTQNMIEEARKRNLLIRVVYI